jgi:hypothetical protein
MTPTRFQFLLDAYGADLRCWPEPERDAAAALLASSPAAAEAQRAARRLDRSLDQARPDISADAVARVLGALDRTPMPAQALPVPPRQASAARWVAPALLGTVALLGFLTGLGDLASEAAAASRAGLVSGVLTVELGF